MADNTTINTGSGTTVATDDVGGVHYQRFKLDGGGDGASVPLVGTAARGLYVDPHPTLSRIQVQSAGLTTATTAYVAGDQLGTQLTFANASRASGQGGTIRTATLLNANSIVGAVDLFLFDRSVTVATDNAANSFSDADMAFCLGVLSFPVPVTSGANSLSTIEFSGLSFTTSATSLFGAMVTRSGHTFFSAVTDLTVSLVIEQA